MSRSRLGLIGMALLSILSLWPSETLADDVYYCSSTHSRWFSLDEDKSTRNERFTINVSADQIILKNQEYFEGGYSLGIISYDQTGSVIAAAGGHVFRFNAPNFFYSFSFMDSGNPIAFSSVFFGTCEKF